MPDPRRMPIGTYVIRQDGKIWRKRSHGDDFQYVGQSPTALPRPMAMQAPVPDASTQGLWSRLARTFQLVGHLPESIPAHHVSIDLDGDTDKKPILAWVEQDGSARYSFSRTFHARRAHAMARAARPILQKVMAGAQASMEQLSSSGNSSPLHAALCAFYATGAKPSTLLALQGHHAVVHGKVPIQKSEGSEEGALLIAEAEEGALEFHGPWPLHEAVAVAAREGFPIHDFHWKYENLSVSKANHGFPHADAMSLIFPDAKVATFCSKPLADYCMVKAEPGVSLFPIKQKEFDTALRSHGLGKVSHGAIRHAIALMASADALSKLPPADLASPNAFMAWYSNLEAASGEVMARMGMRSMPNGLHPIPPGLVLAYAHVSNGKALWGKALENFPWNSTNAPSNSSTSSAPATNAPTSRKAKRPSPMKKSKKPTAMPSRFQEPSATTSSWQPPRVGEVRDGKLIFAKDEDRLLLIEKEGLLGLAATDALGALLPQSLNGAQAKKILDRFKPTPDWKIVKLLLKIAPLSRRAARGDTKASEELRRLSALLRGASTLLEQKYLPALGGPITKGLRGPEGYELGAIRVHADGSIWEKRHDGWHQIGMEDSHSHREIAGEGAKDDDKTFSWRNSPSYRATVQAIVYLRELYRTTTDPSERKVIAEQLTKLKSRIRSLNALAQTQEGTVGETPPAKKSIKVDAEVFPRAATYLASMTYKEAVQAALAADDFIGITELKAILGPET